VRAPRFDISYYHRDLVSPGYWFVAPYGVIDPEAPTQRWEPCQIGPHIYDGDGTLIWSGSCMFDNRNIFDFRAANNIDDDYHLSFILQYNDDEKGFGYVLDGHYEEESIVPVTNDLGTFNMHEFNVLDGGKTAVACAYRPEFMDLGDLGRPGEHAWVMTGGFVELDTATGDVLFEWMSPGHIPIHESVKINPSTPPANKPGWDYIHVNSVDKNEAGDYLLSARFSDTIYLISGKTGDIIWRLGGKYSDFKQNFTFSKQHHAQFVESNNTHITVSFLNNASDERSEQEGTSSALYVQVDMSVSPMTARVVNRYNRPDGSLTRLRGSVQTLPNGNVFTGWSERGYHSEHSQDGKLLMHANFASARFSSYRSYKFPFRGRPSTPPDLVASVYGTDKTDLTTVIHVSWNGATDIASWNFFSQLDAGGIPVLVGSTNKTDFETMYIADGYLDWVSAEAVDAQGKSLGRSRAQRSTVPQSWRAVGFQESVAPTPDDPSVLYSSHNKTAEPEDPYSKAKDAAKAVYKAHEVIRGVGGLLIFILVALSVGAAGAGVYWFLRRRRVRSYSEVPSDDTKDAALG
jgi:hypothetical protein